MATRLPSNLTYNDLNGAEAIEILVDWFRQLLQSQPELQPHLTLPMADITLGVHVGIDCYIGGTVPVSSPPEHRDIDGVVNLQNKFGPGTSGGAHTHVQRDLSARVNAAPIPGGQPPDKLRETHGLPITKPGYGSRETGSHLFLADVPDEVPTSEQIRSRRQGIVAEGYSFAPEEPPTEVELGENQIIEVDNGQIEIDMAGRGIHHAGMVVKDDSHRKSKDKFGDKKGERYSSVNGVYDAGPAGLMNNRGGGGLGSDGRSRISFGNKH